MKKFILLLIVAALVAGFIFIPQKLASDNAAGPGPGMGPGRGGGPGTQGQDTVFAVRTANAERRTLQAYIEVNGNIVSEDQVAVVPDAAGKLVSMKVGLGSLVQKGALVAEVDPSRPGAAYSLSPVYAPISGTVVSHPLTIGSTVSTGVTLLTLAAAGSVEIEAAIPEREVGQLRTGLRAEVFLEAFPGEVFAAEVIRLSPVLDPVSRTKQIVLAFIREDPRIDPGMFARIKLNTRTYHEVVSVPGEAIVENRGITVVYVVSEEAERVRVREIAAGVSVDGEVEIKSGLESGEAVVVQGQQFLTDGAAVRVIGNR
ncbi:MAG: efflux RND transporter periplasmic adaptor subunit [Spirochaetaceae bacterium]|jgi:multidrug efflux pump subunit AcrA (membrane-fusion protein)|nr:efflux RND transporter periplasmic adaptor subunit [Spirochaetaceae bacterium]